MAIFLNNNRLGTLDQQNSSDWRSRVASNPNVGRTRNRDSGGRLSQRRVLPSGIKSRNVSTFIYGTEGVSAETTLGNSQQAFITFSITQNNEYEIKGDVYVALYVDSIDEDNLLPGGSNVDETDWKVVGPYFDYRAWENAGFPVFEDYVSLYVLNISAGTKDVLIYYKWKYVSPREGIVVDI